MNRQQILKAFGWTMAVSAVFALTIGAALISIIVGDWVYIHTQEPWLGWLTGSFVLLAFVLSLGIAIGALLWFKNPQVAPLGQTPAHVPDSLEHIIHAASESTRD